jgi:Ricin-type beta-trefoil lectin domain
METTMRKIVKHIANLGAALAVATSPVLFGAHPAEASTTSEGTTQNLATGRCLDDSTAYGNDVLRGYPCNGLAYQQWALSEVGNGAFRLKNLATGRCLDDSTAYGNDVLRAYPCNSLAYQQWL